MKKHVYPMEPDCYYHVYNRGINGNTLFFNHLNYLYFLKLINEKISTIAEIYSYCLMQNHFHLLVKIKSEHEILLKFSDKNLLVEKIISQQFSNAFNSYTQAVNKQLGRTGKLFELPFRRKIIKNEEQLRNSVLYINANPKKHELKTDLREYKYSSVQPILNDIILKKKITELFGDIANFEYLLENYLPK